MIGEGLKGIRLDMHRPFVAVMYYVQIFFCCLTSCLQFLSPKSSLPGRPEIIIFNGVTFPFIRVS